MVVRWGCLNYVKGYLKKNKHDSKATVSEEVVNSNCILCYAIVQIAARSDLNFNSATRISFTNLLLVIQIQNVLPIKIKSRYLNFQPCRYDKTLSHLMQRVQDITLEQQMLYVRY
mmetsp:Transcript_11035/g.12517  ORF Transcript_11035/g.12517 Transcript_11035/m.12517 type:complete len:115 (-) Transcript_11035:853-1197(-)